MELNKLINRYCPFLSPPPSGRNIMFSGERIVNKVDLDIVGQQVDGNFDRRQNYKFFKTKNQPPTKQDAEVVSNYERVINLCNKGVEKVSSFLVGSRKALTTQNQAKAAAAAPSGQPLHAKQQYFRPNQANNGLISRCDNCSCAKKKTAETCQYCQGRPEIEILLDSDSMTSAPMTAVCSGGISTSAFYPTKENSSRNSSRLNASSSDALNASGLNTSGLNTSNSEANKKYEVDYLFVGTYRFLSRTFIRVTSDHLILNIASFKESINIDFKLIKCLHHHMGKIDNSSRHTYLRIEFLEQAVDAINEYINRRSETDLGSFRFNSINGHEKYFVMKLKFMQPPEALELRDRLRMYLTGAFKEDPSVLQYFEEQREYCLRQRSSRKRQKTSADIKTRHQDGLRDAMRESRSEVMEIDLPCSSTPPPRSLNRPNASGSERVYHTRSMATNERTYANLSSKRPYSSNHSIRLYDDDMEVSEVTQSDLSFKNIKNSKILFESATGETLVILKSDLYCLSDGNFLNDKIIEFYLIYIKSKLIEPAIAAKTYIFSSFFFTKMLSLTKGSQSEEAFNDNLYNLVKKWTKSVDIFEYDYLIVPIFKSSHWSLAIIVYPGKVLLEDDFEIVLDDNYDQKPCIVFMDSMGKSRSVFNRYAKLLRNFLRKECLNKKEKSLDFAHTDIVTFDPEVPCQLNGYDCGIFILNYVELFLKSPEPIISRIQQTKKLEDWFSPSDLRGKRKEIFNILQAIHDENLSNNLKFESDEDATLKSDEEIEILTNDKSEHIYNDKEIKDLLSDDDDTMS